MLINRLEKERWVTYMASSFVSSFRGTEKLKFVIILTWFVNPNSPPAA